MIIILIFRAIDNLLKLLGPKNTFQVWPSRNFFTKINTGGGGEPD